VATPIELMRSGILQNKWESILEAFKMLTGEDLSCPPPNSPKPSRQKKKKSVKVKDVVPIVATQDVEEESNSIPCKTLPFRAQTFKNRFVDDGITAAEDKSFDQKVKPDRLTSRRPPVQFIKVQCSRCQKNETITSDMAPIKIGEEKSFYVCNSCVPRGNRNE
jgi:hypothetical protein